MVILKFLNLNHENELKKFYIDLRNQTDTFRYFDKREYSIIKNHLITIGAFDNDELVGYGHLENFNNYNWLGIAVSEKKKGQGIGNKIMRTLIGFGILKNINHIKLSVDNTNLSALSLYEKYNFKLISEDEGIFFLKLDLSKYKNIFVSTLFMNTMRNKLGELTKNAEKWNIPLEFSSNVEYNISNTEIYNHYNSRKLIHNYFPGDVNSLIINLASTNKKILDNSIKHCRKNIKHTSKKSTLNVFSVHIGFCIDPKFEELGDKIHIKLENINRNLNKRIFVDSIVKLCTYAQKYQTMILIENNVITKDNMINNCNPLLGCSADEIIELIETINMDNCKLLLDTAHLKVSANTLKLNLNREFTKLIPYTYAIHHSDNNGLRDTNDKLVENYWVKDLLPSLTSKINFEVLEVKNISIEEVYEQIAILKL